MKKNDIRFIALLLVLMVLDLSGVAFVWIDLL